MTVESQTPKVFATGNGVATSFPFTGITIFKATEMVVVKTVIATGVETTLVQENTATGYTVVVADFPGTGSITFPSDEVTPMPSSEKLTMKRVLTLEQLLDLNNQGTYFPELQEDQFDKLVMIDIQQQEEIDRSFRFPVSFSGSVSAETDTPAANEVLTINAAGDAMIWAAFSTTDADASNAAGQDVSLSAGASGSSADFSRTDHVHLLPGGATTQAALISGTFAPANKSSDIASASPLVLGTDGNYFDVTGTTSFSAITVALGTGYFLLQFNGVLTMTDSATLDLHGGSIKTAAGGIALFFVTAANTVNLVNYWGEGGQAGAAPMRLGGTIASASPLVINTDGHVFHVSGTTGFSAMTVPVGTFFILEFDGALTMTHSATLDLPEQAANITTRAGDRAICYAQAANDVLVIDFIRSKKVFRGSNSSVAFDSTEVFAHGLGAIPDLVTVGLRCTTDDLGYVASTNDTLFLATNDTAAGDQGVVIWADATTVYATLGVGFQIIDESTKNTAGITASSWSWVVTAVLF